MKKGIITGMILVCIFLMYQYPHAMINPGELMKGHQKMNDRCFDCHLPFGGISSSKCIICHKISGIGKNKFKSGRGDSAEMKMMFHQHLSNQPCGLCHTEHQGINPGTSVRGFDHEVLPASVKNNCNNCHVQPGDHLHALLSRECIKCHSPGTWNSSISFNHELITGTDRNNCISCHKKPQDDFHIQGMENCSGCHNYNRWKPSTFDHSRYFRFDGNHPATCKTCHTNNNYKSFTCYNCHEHSENKIMEEHAEHQVLNLKNCTACHRSGNEHDILLDGETKQELNNREQKDIRKHLESHEKKREKEERDD